MKASELRMGNLVFAGGIMVPVESIDKKGVNVYQDIFGELSYDGYFSVGVDLISPIPLTEDWMVRFRFIEMGVYFEKYNCKFGFCFEDGELDVWIKNQDQEDCYICSVSYVHQFQNIYFALTGEELTLT